MLYKLNVNSVKVYNKHAQHIGYAVFDKQQLIKGQMNIYAMHFYIQI